MDKQKDSENIPSGTPKKSLIVTIQEVASLLRTEVKNTSTLKLKEKQAKILSLQTLGPSMENNIKQVAKLLREQTPKKTPKEKRGNLKND